MFRLFFFIKRNIFWLVSWSIVFQTELFYARFSSLSDPIKVEHIQLIVPLSKDSDQTMVRQGIVLRVTDPKGTIVLCHGYQSDKYEALFFIRLFPHFNVISFDFRAHGEQIHGQYSTIGGNEPCEVLAAAHFAKRDPFMKSLPLLAFGYSMGAASVIGAQAQESIFDALLLDCPFDSTNSALRRGVGNDPSIKILGRTYTVPVYAWIQKYLYNERARPFMRFVFQHITNFDPKVIQTKYMLVEPEKTIAAIKAPVFFIRCNNDTKVPLQAIMKIYNNKKEGFKRLWLTPGRWHCDSYGFQPDQYKYRINKFLNLFLQGACDKVPQARIIDDRDDRDKGDGEEQ